MFVQSDAGPLEVEITATLMRLVLSLQKATTTDEALGALTEADVLLDELEHNHDERQSDGERQLPIGMTIRFPGR